MQVLTTAQSEEQMIAHILVITSDFQVTRHLLLYVIFLIAKLMSLSQHISFPCSFCLSAVAGLIKCK